MPALLCTHRNRTIQRANLISRTPEHPRATTRNHAQPDLEIEMLAYVYLPLKADDISPPYEDDDYGILEPEVGYGFRPRRVPLVDSEQLDQLHQVGIYTVRDLAEADTYQIIKLRGYDYPQVPEERRLQTNNLTN